MKDRIILDLCGGTGSWSKPYADAGYTVYNITLPEFNIEKFYFSHADKSISFIGKKLTLNVPIEKRLRFQEVYGILAAPPCQMFSFARQNAKTPRDIPGAFETVKKCREIIEACAMYGNLKFWCMENPRGHLRKILGIPRFTFERWQYGDPGAKATDLWGYFNVPKIKPRPELRDPDYITDKTWNDLSIPAGYNPPGEDRKAIKRAMTPPGFAKAFFKANK